MFNTKLKEMYNSQGRDLAEKDSQLDALKVHMAFIEFTPDGIILDANPLFLGLMGYSRDRIVGQHHRMFCSADSVAAPSYKRFWSELKAGKAHVGTFRRLRADGEGVWLEATYFPVLDNDGRVVKVIKIAADVTAEKSELLSKDALVAALDRSMAVIEFSPSGDIIAANRNFLNVMGYSLEQLRGKHHRVFCTDTFYQQNPHFWAELAKG